MGKVIIIFLFVYLISQINASCSDNQIDINSASLEELDKIIWVGPATAEKIISTRPFKSVDNLIDVSGIGEIKLNAIKEEGLACVEDEEKEQDNENEQEKVLLSANENVEEEEFEKKLDYEDLNLIEKEPEVIKLSPKDIKSANDKEFSFSNYAKYGFMVFCVLLVILFIVKKDKFRKNEFDE